MSDDRTTVVSTREQAVPLDPPPVYEPKPDDLDTVHNEHASNTRHSAAKWKKLLFTLSLAVFSLWFAYILLHAFTTRPRVLYSSSYSKEYRFRPAASPIITETLADGRTRIRGAQPTLRE